MAEDKKGFLLYADLIHTVEKMPDDKAGLLLKHILKYVNDDHPITDDLLVEIAFEPIKQQLKRDLDKWDTIKGKRSDAGKKSGEARRLKAEQKEHLLTGVQSVEQTPTKRTVSGNVTVTVNDTVTVNNIKERKQSFLISLKKYDSLGADFNTITDFFEYWTEHGEKDKKMKFEKEKSFSTELRLKRWLKNSSKFGGPKSKIDKAKDTATEVLGILRADNQNEKTL